MAVAVPFLMSATGASAAIAGAIGAGVTATMVSTVTAITFAVTGISEKINKAASKVFGEDLVNFANIAGAGYAMWNGGFDLGGSAAEAAGGEMLTASTPELTTEAWNAAGADNLAAINEAAGVTDGMATAATGSNSFNLGDLKGMDDGSYMSDVASYKAPVIDETTSTNMITGKQGITDAKEATTAAKVETPNAAAPATPTAQASTPTATANVAAKANATAGVQPTATQAAATTTGDQNVFQKLFADKTGAIDKRLVGASLQAVGGAFSAASANRLKKEQYDAEMARRDSMSRIRYA